VSRGGHSRTLAHVRPLPPGVPLGNAACRAPGFGSVPGDPGARERRPSGAFCRLHRSAVRRRKRSLAPTCRRVSRPATGLSQKIPWFISRRYPVRGTLVVVGRRLGSVTGRFKYMLHQSWSPSNPKRWVFPSSFSPPSAGCWRLAFQSGRVTGGLAVLVSSRPS
jgi:hypothetical protein